MRVIAAMFLSMSLASVPLLAKDAKDAGKDETPATAAAETAKEAAKPENAVIESELQDLRSLVQSQMQELESQRAALKAQQLKMEVLEEKLHATPSEPVSAPVSESAATFEATPGAGIGSTPHTLTASAAMPAQGGAEEKPSPLYFKIGAAEFYPLGFMDMMGVYRTTNLGGIATSFGSIAFNNSAPAGRLSEFRFSTQNSRIGLRTHAKFGEADVTGYLEADFLGYLPPNGEDTSNSNSLRTRLYWVDYKKGMFEMLGGQSWSFLTPNRTGLGALPGDLFYSQDVDTNYQLGLTWARQTSFRVILHPTNNFAIGVSLENPQQTLPNSVTVPAPYTNGTGAGSQFDTNSSDTSVSATVKNPNVPNLHPDIILKAAFDAKPGGRQVHFDVAGLFRTFKMVNLVPPVATPVAATTSIHGGGIAGTLNIELIKNFRAIATGFYSYAGGRYIASTGGPDVIIRPDGTLQGIHSGSGIGGFEWQPNPKTVLYGYYSGAYFGKGFGTVTSGSTTSFVGYGYPGSANSNNRYIFEPTIGIHYMMWRNPNYGDLRIMTQYSYISRAPWAILSNQPGVAHLSMVYVDLRYDLP
jgi:hypothetical protein